MQWFTFNHMWIFSDLPIWLHLTAVSMLHTENSLPRKACKAEADIKSCSVSCSREYTPDSSQTDWPTHADTTEKNDTCLAQHSCYAGQKPTLKYKLKMQFSDKDLLGRTELKMIISDQRSFDSDNWPSRTPSGLSTGNSLELTKPSNNNNTVTIGIAILKLIFRSPASGLAKSQAWNPRILGYWYSKV